MSSDHFLAYLPNDSCYWPIARPPVSALRHLGLQPSASYVAALEADHRLPERSNDSGGSDASVSRRGSRPNVREQPSTSELSGHATGNKTGSSCGGRVGVMIDILRFSTPKCRCARNGDRGYRYSN